MAAQKKHKKGNLFTFPSSLEQNHKNQQCKSKNRVKE